MIRHDRRTFMKTTAGAALTLGTVTSRSVIGAVEPPRPGKSRVAVVGNPAAISDRNVCDPEQARRTVDAALQAVTGRESPEDAWTALGVTPDDVVGIKVNCNTWTFLLHTHPELVYAVCDSLATVVRPNNIIIYERYTSELTRSGYRANTGSTGVRAFGNDEGGGYDPKQQLTRTVTDTCTKLINMPSLKTVEGEFAGSLFLKNHIGSLPNAHMSRCHGNAGFCTEVCARPGIRDKTILGICDGLRGTYGRGRPWYYRGVIASTDQIAAECVCLNEINAKRAQESLPALDIPDYVRDADTGYGLGTSDRSKMDIVTIDM